MKYIIFDTETNSNTVEGINIITDKPFLYQYAVVDDKLNMGPITVFSANDTRERLKFIELLKKIPTFVGHNIKFDVHMALNDDIPQDIFVNKNYIDTQVLARLVIPADTQTEPSFSTALKQLSVRYLGIHSANEERVLKSELSLITSKHKQEMKEYFIKENVWTQYKPVIETKILNDIYHNWNKIYHLYDHLKQERIQFLKQNPMPTYEKLTNVRVYAETDIKLTYGLFKLWYPKIPVLKQTETLKRLSNATYPLVVMERTGLSVDIKRIANDRNAILRELKRVQIIDQRDNTVVNIGQHAKLKALYEFEANRSLKGADKNVREEILEVSPAARAADYIAKLDKYLKTYISGILKNVQEVNGDFKVYTQYNMAGTVTGRLSSNFQQFPAKALELQDGTIINIRDWFVVPKDYKYIFYFDYAQMELRLQCEWTNIITGTPDLNLARAFSPYMCIEKDGQHYLEENPTQVWVPSDLHAITAMHAFPHITPNDPDFKHYRSLGKRANFACNYGAAPAKIAESLKVPFSTAEALHNGYKKTFPGVIAFTKWLRNYSRLNTYTPNLLLRNYYSRNAHQLQNWLVQGSGADILLLKTKQIYDYIKDKPHWQLLISVHDETGLVCKDIPLNQLEKEVKEMKQIMTHHLEAVDIISDVEYTTTTWANKKDWEAHA
jgi:DNA polymerase I-like protein with 3'-5' exonuclease and polymerase domains